MLYLIIDLNTGETVDKARTQVSAERKCTALDSTRAWIDGHVFGYVLA